MAERDEGTGPDVTSAYRDRTPDPRAEDRLVRALRAEGLLLPPGAGWRSWIVRTAAAALLFAGGWGSARVTAPEREAAPPVGAVSAARSVAGAPSAAQPYMLLLWVGDEYEMETDLAARVDEYAAWAGSVADRGVPITGAPLVGDRVVFPSPRPADAGPEVIAGYFIVEVDDAAEAAELAAEHPHLRHGGRVEVAPIG